MKAGHAFLCLILLATPAKAQDSNRPSALDLLAAPEKTAADPTVQTRVPAPETVVIPSGAAAAPTSLLPEPDTVIAAPEPETDIEMSPEDARPVTPVALPVPDAPQVSATEQAPPQNDAVPAATADVPAAATAPQSAPDGLTDAQVEAISALLSMPASSAQDEAPVIPKACARKQCVENLEIQFKSPDSLPIAYWPAGKYQFLVEADDTPRITCIAALPLPENCEPDVKCDGPGVSLKAAGCGKPLSQQGFTSLILNKIPQKYTVRVTYQSGRNFIVEDDFVRPVCSFPNGEACDPHPCCRVDVEKTVDMDW